MRVLRYTMSASMLTKMKKRKRTVDIHRYLSKGFKAITNISLSRCFLCYSLERGAGNRRKKKGKRKRERKNEQIIGEKKEIKVQEKKKQSNRKFL